MRNLARSPRTLFLKCRKPLVPSLVLRILQLKNPIRVIECSSQTRGDGEADGWRLLHNLILNGGTGRVQITYSSGQDVNKIGTFSFPGSQEVMISISNGGILTR